MISTSMMSVTTSQLLHQQTAHHNPIQTQTPLGSASSSLSSSSSCSSTSSYSILNQEVTTSTNNSTLLLKTNLNMQQQQQQQHNNNNNNNNNNNSHETSYHYEKENDSGIETKDEQSVLVRVSVSDQNVQKVLKLHLDETVWCGKQRLLGTLAKEVKDGLNYGLYLPPYQGRAGKFLDDCRKLREYPLSYSGPLGTGQQQQIPTLEFKYKNRVYKFVKINQK